MKPSLGRTVYCIYHDTILREEVYAVGKDSFIVGSFGDDTCPDSWEWWFEQYNETWFTSLDKAKKAIMNSGSAKHYINPVIVRAADGYYELREKTYLGDGKWKT